MGSGWVLKFIEQPPTCTFWAECFFVTIWPKTCFSHGIIAHNVSKSHVLEYICHYQCIPDFRLHLPLSFNKLERIFKIILSLKPLMFHVHSCVRREKLPKEWEGLSEVKVKNEGGVGERKKGNEHLPSLPDHGTYAHILGQCLLHLFEFCGMHLSLLTNYYLRLFPLWVDLPLYNPAFISLQRNIFLVPLSSAQRHKT